MLFPFFAAVAIATAVDVGSAPFVSQSFSPQLLLLHLLLFAPVHRLLSCVSCGCLGCYSQCNSPSGCSCCVEYCSFISCTTFCLLVISSCCPAIARICGGRCGCCTRWCSVWCNCPNDCQSCCLNCLESFCSEKFSCICSCCCCWFRFHQRCCCCCVCCCVICRSAAVLAALVKFPDAPRQLHPPDHA